MDDYSDWIRKYRALKKDALYPFDLKKEAHFEYAKNDIVEKRHQLEVVKDKLNDISIRQLGKCKANLLASIDKALELTSPSRSKYSLSRSQGLIIPNYVYGKVWGIVESGINSPTGFSYPEIYYDTIRTFDSTALIKLLEDFKSELIPFQPTSFIHLESLYEKYDSKLISLWKEENARHPGII